VTGDCNLGYHHIINDANEYYVYTAGFHESRDNYKIKSTGTRRGGVPERGVYNLVYSFVSFLSGDTGELLNQVRGNFNSGHIDRGHNVAWISSIEHNFEYDAFYQQAYGTYRYWDNTENAWRVINASDFSDYGQGWFETIYVPSNVTVRVQSQIKLAPSYSGNFPRLEARSTVSGVGPNQYGNAGGAWSSWMTGGATATSFTIAAASAYETKELTINPVAFPRYINIGVHVDDANASEGYWMRDTIVLMDKPYANKYFSTSNSAISGQPKVGIGSSLSEKRVRLSGGRII
jgi:hypothetical protein